jgi:hypothetical protein
MQSNRTDRSPLLIWASALLGGALWLLLSADTAAFAIAPVAGVAVVGFNWQRSRAHSRRQQAALDAYAEFEIARANGHSGPVRSGRAHEAGLLRS